MKKDLDKNIVYISHKENVQNQAVKALKASSIHWIHEPGKEGENYSVKLRHGPKLLNANFKMVADGKMVVFLDESDKGAAAGQSVIFYDGINCLGRAVIDGPLEF